jgi:propionyl-CoA carboxylase beta chain
MNAEQRLQKLDELNARVMLGGGEKRIERQHSLGKKTARERFDMLFDPGTFVEIDKFVVHRCTDFGLQDQKFLGDGVVTGYGRVNGRKVFAFAQDFTVFGGSLSEAFAAKMCKIMDLAGRVGAPVVGLNDGAGARIHEGVNSLGGYGDVFLRNVMMSGVVPQISTIMGPCAGGSVYSPILTDFLLMVRETSNMFITGPEVVKSVTYEDVTPEALGGADVHATKSGIAHFATASEEECIDLVKKLLSFLPSNNTENPPFVATQDPSDRMDPALATVMPEDANAPYDIRDIILKVVDEGRFFEVHEHYGQNLVVGFARFAGRAVGIVANQPNVMAGSLDIEGSRKGARFVRLCDCFNVPLVTFVDTPGFIPGSSSEHAGIIIHGGKLLYAFCEATVPRITVVTRKAFGGAYVVMNSKHIRADVNLAYPSAQIAVMGPSGAANIVFRREIKDSDDPAAKRAELQSQYTDTFANPYKAAELGFIDDVILPEQTRPRIIDALEMLSNKRAENPPKKHGNIPL